jgi:hypothetical protein
MLDKSKSLAKLFSADAVPASLSTLLAPTRTAPDASDGVFDCAPPGASGVEVFHAVEFNFTGTGADDATYIARIWRWKAIRDAAGALIEWVPTRVGDFAITLGTSVGVAGGGLGTSERYADVIAESGTPPSPDYEIASPADNGIASLLVNTNGARYLQIQIGTTATATGGNTLACGL